MGKKNVKVILINPEGKIFLLHREDIPKLVERNTWSFVGGGVEEGETPEEALIRETKEEIGYDLEKMEFFKEYDDPGIRRYVFVAKIDKEINEINLTEGDDMGFFSLEEARDMNLSKNTRRYIEDYFSNH